MRSPRQLKVGEEIRHVLAMLFQRGDVPWPKDFVAPMITITEVQISPDLRNATAFFTTMGEGDAAGARRVLNGMVGFFRHALAEAVKLRYVPKLDFRQDTSFSYASNIERILKDPAVARDLVQERDEGIDFDAVEEDTE